MFVSLFLLKMPGGHAIWLRRGGSGRPRCHFLPLCKIYWRATLSYPAAMWLCSVCVCVRSLTLRLDEMEYLCCDLSRIFHIPCHEIPIHSFQLPQQHHYLGVTGNAAETRKRHGHL